ncbi:MAG: response regulator transcription factor [Flavobacteriales bacterium]|jgi:DNA-binding NarL/FixJ family response regulator|nr:response regulator transcription factor [Flavobacteriales bacterium]
MSKIKIALVDDHSLFTETLKNMLANEDDFIIVGTFTTASSFINFVEKQRVDVCLMDLGMPHLNGFQAVEQTKKYNAYIKFIALTMSSSAKSLNQAKSVGFDGYLIKNTSYNDLKTAIKRVSQGQKVYDLLPDDMKISSEESQENKIDFSVVTKREKEILGLILDSKTTEEIAAKLYISENTVKTHRKNIFRKLKIKNSAGLLHIAEEYDLWLR